MSEQRKALNPRLLLVAITALRLHRRVIHLSMETQHQAFRRMLGIQFKRAPASQIRRILRALRLPLQMRKRLQWAPAQAGASTMLQRHPLETRLPWRMDLWRRTLMARLRTRVNNARLREVSAGPKKRTSIARAALPEASDEPCRSRMSKIPAPERFIVTDFICSTNS